jgi:hypothetical protein
MSSKKFKFTKTTTDPETGTISSDVEYIPDLAGNMELFNNFIESFKSLKTETKDPKIETISSKLQLLRNEYRTHLRKNYPDEYKKIFSESSITGGEGYMTNKSFKSKDELKEHLKQHILRLVKEELTADPKKFQQERIDIFDIIEKTLNELYPYVSKAKNKTVEYYKTNPTSFDPLYPTDIMMEIINELKTLLTK